jgi:hydroxymethylpyrimidine pyrophosphatase-like HAD family hydrolase
MPLFIGNAIVATQEPNQGVVAEIIEALQLPLRIIMNKGSVMALPGGVNKASGLRAALRQRGWDARRTVAIGDAENDYDLLAAAGFAAAVSNAVPGLKAQADVVTQASHGAGVVELIDLWLAGKLVRRPANRDFPGLT